MRSKLFSSVAVSLTAVGCGGAEMPGEAPAEASVETTSQAVQAGTQLFGYVAYAPGEDYNRCVPDAANVLNRMNARGDLIGLHYSAAGYTGLDGETWHAQGIARLPYYSWDTVLLGGYMVAAFDHPGGTGDDNEGHLGVASFGFTGGNNGNALGTNRSYNYNWDGDTADWNVTPNPSDTFISVNGTPKYHIDPNQNHPGGVSGIGWHVAFALQKYAYQSCYLFGSCGYTPSDSQPLVKIYNFWNPWAPTLSTSFLTSVNGSGTDNMAVAITKLADGRFLIAVDKSSPVGRTEFYVSNGTNLDSPGVFGSDGRAPDAVWTTNPGWQNMNFITDCSGALYLLGTNGGDQDFVALRRVDLFQGGTAPDPYYRVNVVTPPAPSENYKHMYCSDNSNTDQCDMGSAAGTYVDPNGHVIVYATGYDNDGGATSYVHGGGAPWYGSYPAYGGYVRGVEFHERHGNADPSSACPTLDTAWVEFYQNANFNSNGDDAGTYYRIDHLTADTKNGKFMGTNDFNDTASSVRWCIPPGNSFAMFRDVWSGSYQFLNGTGDVRSVSYLGSYNYSNGGGNMNDSITSYAFYDGYTDPNGWSGTYDSAD